MHLRSSWKLLAAIGVGGGLALAGPVRPAVGFHSPPEVLSVEVGDTATLVARGAAISVPVEVVCPAGSSGFLSVNVSQRAGSRIASGFGGTGDFLCTGTTQIVNVTVTAQDLAFKRGTAVASSTLNVFSPFFGQSVTDEEIIQITR
jgi:hypothetical protein